MNIKTLAITGALAIACAINSPANAETITIDSIVQLSKIGLGDEAIIAKLRAEEAQFDLSTEQMIALKSQGVSSAVIAAMMAPIARSQPAMSMDSPDWRIPHPSGLYLLSGSDAAARMVRIDPTVSSQAKTGGIFGYALTGGIASMSIKVAIANETARVSTYGSQRFYMFFDESNNVASPSAMASGSNAVVTSPAEFTLIRLNKKDGRREARVGSANIGGAKTGVMDKDRIAFQHQMVRQGVYQVDIPSLESGEYAFIFPIAGGGANGAMTAKLFDFSIR